MSIAKIVAAAYYSIIYKLTKPKILKFQPTASNALTVCTPSVEISLSAGFDLLKITSKSRQDCSQKVNPSVIHFPSTSSYVGLHKTNTLPISRIK